MTASSLRNEYGRDPECSHVTTLTTITVTSLVTTSTTTTTTIFVGVRRCSGLWSFGHFSTRCPTTSVGWLRIWQSSRTQCLPHWHLATSLMASCHHGYPPTTITSLPPYTPPSPPLAPSDIQHRKSIRSLTEWEREPQ